MLKGFLRLSARPKSRTSTKFPFEVAVHQVVRGSGWVVQVAFQAREVCCPDFPLAPKDVEP
jgi:hypothetical protein